MKSSTEGWINIDVGIFQAQGYVKYSEKRQRMIKQSYYKCTIDRTLYTISVNVPEITENWNAKEYISSDLLALDSEEEIIDEIGDYHIRSIMYGRRYNTEIRIEYTSEDAYELLKGQLKAEIGMGVLKVSAEVQLELESESFEEDLTMSVGSEALGFIEAQPLYLPSQTLSKKLEDGTVEQVSINDQIDEMIQKNLKAFNEIDADNKIVPRTGLSKSELFAEIGTAYPLWYTVDKNLRYFKDKLTKLSAFEEEQMLENLDQAYDIMRELQDMTDNIEQRAEQLFDSYHLLSGATALSLEFLTYRQSLMDKILAYREEVIDYIEQPAKRIAAQDIYLWAASDPDRNLRHISMDVLATKIWDLLGMEDVEMADDNEVGAACLFNGVQAILEGDNRRRKFAGRVIFGDKTVRHVLFNVNGSVVSLGYIDHEHANRDNPEWKGIPHELVFVREDCTLLQAGSDVWYHKARYKISSIGSDEHLTPKGYVNKDKLTNVRMHLQPQDATREIEVVITDSEIRDVELRGTKTSSGFTVDATDRLMYKNGYVCDKDFRKYEANMICTHLGYADVLYYQTGFEIPASNAWGRPRIAMVDLNCPALAFKLDQCTYKDGDAMDDQLWGSCKTQNGVQLKCINQNIPSEENANMEVISEIVSCVRNEESMNERIDTAESCSGADGGDADTFGNVQKVVVKGDICVKLYRNERLECVISEKSSDWDFTLPDTLERFCYDTYGQSVAEFPFPDQIEMMPTHRPETCRDQLDLLTKAKLSYWKNSTRVPMTECTNPKEEGLCDSNNNKLSAEEQRIFNVACHKTCSMCIVNTRQYYQIKVVPKSASFALNNDDRIPVEVTLKGGPSDKSKIFDALEEYVFDGDYECGSRIQLVATPLQPYNHGEVVCSMSMISKDGRIDTDGHVMVSGDIKVTFQCMNPPSSSPSVSPSVAPVLGSQSPTLMPTQSPTLMPTMQPTAEPTMPKALSYFGPREDGFCVRSNGADQNSQVIKASGEFVNDASGESDCLRWCMTQEGLTGCEFIWGQSNKGCYAHRAEVSHGNNADRHFCWIAVDEPVTVSPTELYTSAPIEVSTAAPAFTWSVQTPSGCGGGKVVGGQTSFPQKSAEGCRLLCESTEGCKQIARPVGAITACELRDGTCVNNGASGWELHSQKTQFECPSVDTWNPENFNGTPSENCAEWWANNDWGANQDCGACERWGRTKCGSTCCAHCPL